MAAATILDLKTDYFDLKLDQLDQTSPYSVEM